MDDADKYVKRRQPRPIEEIKFSRKAGGRNIKVDKTRRVRNLLPRDFGV
jgi:hypothetical protein